MLDRQKALGWGWLSWLDLAVLGSTQAHSLQKKQLQRRVLWACRKSEVLSGHQQEPRWPSPGKLLWLESMNVSQALLLGGLS